MREVRVKTPNYACDLSGICSALYELGGLIVMHDASGCNSTFATHDEPRWYDVDSMVYISGLTEYDAVLGNDDAYIDDVVEIALERHPRFVAVFGSPVALLMGTDFRGVARIIERRCGIPTFWFKTSGMESYIVGASQALAGVASRLCPDRTPSVRPARGDRLRVNLLGVTPLDFSVAGNAEALVRFCDESGFELVSSWAMGDTLDDLLRAGEADVNLVVSSLGLACAEVLAEKYGTPHVVGCPIGTSASVELARLVRETTDDGGTRTLGSGSGTRGSGRLVTVIGEAVFAASLRQCLVGDLGEDNVRIACPLVDPCHMLGPDDVSLTSEEDAARVIRESDLVIADPLYEVLLDGKRSDGSGTTFVRLPHEAFSGRMFRDEIPCFVGRGFKEALRGDLAGAGR